MKKKQVFLLALMMLALFMLCGCGAKQEMSSAAPEIPSPSTIWPSGRRARRGISMSMTA